MKKLITILLILAASFTSIFAYTAPSVILTASKTEVNYEFKVQKLNAAMDDWEDFTAGQAELVDLTPEGGITNAFTIATKNTGNMHNQITFTTTVTTGQFISTDPEPIESGWYPIIRELSVSATAENYGWGDADETVTYSAGSNGAIESINYNIPSIGTFTTIFSPGVHNYGIEIARFNLKYKTDDNLIAGTYRSNTTIDIQAN